MVHATLAKIAGIADSESEYDQAMELYKQSLEISKQLGDQQGAATTLTNIAEMHKNKGEYEESLFYVLQANTILERTDVPPRQFLLDILHYIESKFRKRSLSKTCRESRRSVELTATRSIFENIYKQNFPWVTDQIKNNFFRISNNF
jgi:tetratricopeptide (TPR) repeat protein